MPAKERVGGCTHVGTEGVAALECALVLNSRDADDAHLGVRLLQSGDRITSADCTHRHGRLGRGGAELLIELKGAGGVDRGSFVYR